MLKRYISIKLAANALLLVLGALLVLHILVLSGFAPFNIVWGGHIETSTQRLIMELVAALITILMMVMVAIRAGYINAPRLKEFSHTAMWVIFVFLMLNTIGNLTSSAKWENLIFTPITVLLMVFTYRLAMKEE